MVYAFIIQTLDSKESEILYYRMYSSLSKEMALILSDDLPANATVDSNTCAPLFQSSIEKKDFLNFIVNKIKMLYILKLKQSLISVSQNKDTIIKGVFKERNWKSNLCDHFVVTWQIVHGLGFSLVCKKDENYVHAQNMLDIVVSQLDKYLHFFSNPAVALKSIEAVTLVINQFLPSGQLLFVNSGVVESFEKQLEKDLYSK